MNNDHLISYKIGYRTINLNLIQLTDIRFVNGSRRFKHYRIERMSRKFWKHKHPILSKFFCPYRPFMGDYWDNAGIYIMYGGVDAFYISFKSNNAALEAKNKIKSDLWQHFTKYTL